LLPLALLAAAGVWSASSSRDGVCPPIEPRPARADEAALLNASAPAPRVVVPPESEDARSRRTAAPLLVRGKVEAWPEETPLGGVTLRLSLHRGEAVHELSTSVSDESGRFAFELAPSLGGASAPARAATEVVVLAHAPGWASDLDGASIADLREAELELHLTRQAVLRGRVVDMEGRAIAGAQVEVEREQVDAQETRVVDTDATGRFEVEDVRAGEACLVSARHPAHGRSSVRVLSSLGTNGASIDDLVLRPQGVLHGRVVSPSGAPRRGMCISVEDVAPDGSEGDGEVFEFVETDASGRFAFRDLDDGCYVVDATDAASRVLHPGAGEILLVVDRPVARVRVVDDRSQLVRGAALTAFPVGRTDAGRVISLGGADEGAEESRGEDGAFWLTFWSPGEYALRAQVAAREVEWIGQDVVHVEDLDLDVELRLEPVSWSASLELSVVDDAGAPLRFHAALVDPRTDRSVAFLDDATLPDEGALPAGRWRLRVYPRGDFLAPLEVPLALSPAQRCELRLVSTRRGGKLEVELRAQGEEHAPFQLRVARGDGPWEPPEHFRVHYSHGSMICDHLDSGCWTSTRTFEPGALRLRAYDSEGRTVERRVLVRAGEITRATFDFSDG